MKNSYRAESEPAETFLPAHFDCGAFTGDGPVAILISTSLDFRREQAWSKLPRLLLISRISILAIQEVRGTIHCR
jgi:hypothetical protein